MICWSFVEINNQQYASSFCTKSWSEIIANLYFQFTRNTQGKELFIEVIIVRNIVSREISDY